MVKGFTEEEVNKYIGFLNYIVENAQFPNHLETKKALNWVKMLTFQEKIILNKMQDLIVGEAKLHTPTKKETASKK